LFSSVTSYCQIDSSNTRIDPGHITTQGEQEQYRAQEIFDKQYEIQSYDRYKGEITLINMNTIRYDNNIITARFIHEEYRIIFETGLFYPAIFSGYKDGRILEVQKRPDSAYHNLLSRNDSLVVGIMEEFKFLNPSYIIKRYKLYLSRPGIANPSMYVFELTNETATETTDLKTFLTEAKLTFFKFVSILI
jgi:hypothetical protein